MMTIGRLLIIFLLLIIVCLVKSEHSTIIPDPKRERFINVHISKPRTGTIPTTTPMRSLNPTVNPTVSPILYDLILNLSNVGIQNIGPDFIICGESIRLILDKNGISNISSLALRGMPNLKYLSMSHNKIPTNKMLSFVKVDSLQTLIINNNNPISSIKTGRNVNDTKYDIPTGIFTNLKHLHICHSQLKDFQLHHWTMPVLTDLHLSNNSIKSSNIIFDHIPKTLRNLLLDNNQIKQVEKSKLRYLQKLIMDGNLITEICFELCEDNFISLKDATNMETLSLARNRITKISVNAFKDTTLLSYLDLSGNNITEVTKGTFNNINRMKHLSLADNKLTTIPRDICSLKYLTSLNLTGNHINIIYANTFCSLPTLEELYLANNNITVIESQAFGNLQRLKYLDLSQNQLQKLPHQWSQQRNDLEELHLEKNNIIELDDVALANMKNLKNLYINENPMLHVKTESFRSLPMHFILHIDNTQSINQQHTNINNIQKCDKNDYDSDYD